MGKASGIPPGQIVIGMPIALTGVIQLYDRGLLQKGAQIAAADFNKRGGIRGHKIKIITADTKSIIPRGTTGALQVVIERRR